jgi:hypothetical protein
MKLSQTMLQRHMRADSETAMKRSESPQLAMVDAQQLLLLIRILGQGVELIHSMAKRSKKRRLIQRARVWFLLISKSQRVPTKIGRRVVRILSSTSEFMPMIKNCRRVIVLVQPQRTITLLLGFQTLKLRKSCHKILTLKNNSTPRWMARGKS